MVVEAHIRPERDNVKILQVNHQAAVLPSKRVAAIRMSSRSRLKIDACSSSTYNGVGDVLRDTWKGDSSWSVLETNVKRCDE